MIMIIVMQYVVKPLLGKQESEIKSGINEQAMAKILTLHN